MHIYLVSVQWKKRLIPSITGQIPRRLASEGCVGQKRLIGWRNMTHFKDNICGNSTLQCVSDRLDCGCVMAAQHNVCLFKKVYYSQYGLLVGILLFKYCTSKGYVYSAVTVGTQVGMLCERLQNIQQCLNSCAVCWQQRHSGFFKMKGWSA